MMAPPLVGPYRPVSMEIVVDLLGKRKPKKGEQTDEKQKQNKSHICVS